MSAGCKGHVRHIAMVLISRTGIARRHAETCLPRWRAVNNTHTAAGRPQTIGSTFVPNDFRYVALGGRKILTVAGVPVNRIGAILVEHRVLESGGGYSLTWFFVCGKQVLRRFLRNKASS